MQNVIGCGIYQDKLYQKIEMSARRQAFALCDITKMVASIFQLGSGVHVLINFLTS